MDERKHIIYLSLGSNLGDRKEHIERALTLLEMELGKMVLKSSYYVSKAWGQDDLNDFYNLVATFETSLDAHNALIITQSIEKELGRLKKISTKRYHNRVIDIDILFLDRMIIDTINLIVPHPLMHQRKFVLMPLSETYPSFLHPILKKTVMELLNFLDDKLECKKC
ncbi:MAG: 2-amino-4-hydroxy-6-hydroxymethyldihydropteridine diphosphokinase [Flavobacteriales bacterium]|nr:2-amino-4-hydroxy-6-hydroxymethyldihydropteridine diphosphokinase [Flavobacteriales bacterium]